MTMDRPDWIIPLGSGSKSNDDELRILLRSLERNARPLGRVIVVTDRPPAWLTRARVLPVPDLPGPDKDRNILRKLAAAVRAFQVSSFVLSCDDCALMRPLDPARIPVIFNRRGKADFAPGVDAGRYRIWYDRVYRTLLLAEALGRPLAHNYEAHVPQLHRDAQALMERLRAVNLAAGGLTAFTLLRILEVETGGEDQAGWRSSHEGAERAGAPLDRPFCGYADGGFLNGLRERLFKVFPTPSRFER